MINNTSTVDGAEAYERFHADPEDVYFDEQDEFGDSEEEEECGCSDWGCPCGGTKSGTL